MYVLQNTQKPNCFFKDPDLVEAFNIKRVMIAKYSEHLMRIFCITMKNAIAFIEETYPLIATKMKIVIHKIQSMGQIYELLNYELKEFCVLNNGDFSITNVHFNQDSDFTPLMVMILSVK